MIIKLKTALLLLLAGIFIQSGVRAQAKKPNIVFFLVDDLGWTDVEPFGTSFYETPNIKKLTGRVVLRGQYNGAQVLSRRYGLHRRSRRCSGRGALMLQ